MMNIVSCYKDVRLLMPSCSLLYGQRRFDEFVVCAKQVLFSSCMDLSEKSVLRGGMLLSVIILSNPDF